jgi:hypothetical protein
VIGYPVVTITLSKNASAWSMTITLAWMMLS